MTNAEILRDVEKLFGGSFEAFCAKVTACDRCPLVPRVTAAGARQDSSGFQWTSNVVTLSNLGK